MNILAIDVGTYSIKFTEGVIDKKKLKILHYEEKILPPIPVTTENQTQENDQNDTSLSLTPWEEKIMDAQTMILKDYLQTLHPSVKIIYQAPIDFISSRFFDLPVDKKKKAEMMVPFQLEEDIPYSINDIHLSHSLYPENKSFQVIASFLPKQRFEEYFNYLQSKELLPAFLLHEPSAIAHYFSNSELIMEDNFCVLDIGHKSTKAYFFHNKKLKSFHICYIAGITIDSMVTDIYKVNPQEAREFKHKNAFFLTLDQYHDVNPKQRDFAQQMDEIFSPLISDFKRWDISFRVNYGQPIENVYLMGGTSKVKNIENYIAQNIQKTVRFLPLEPEASPYDQQFLNYANSYFFANNLKKRPQVSNLLIGDYSVQNNEDLPIFSMSYIATRSLIFFVMILSLLLVESWVLSTREKKLNVAGMSVLKNPQLSITRSQRNLFRKKPHLLINSLNKKLRDFEKQIKSINQFKAKNALISLFQMTKAIPMNECALAKYEHTFDDNVQAEFQECKLSELQKVQQSLKTSSLSSLNSSIKNNKLVISFQADL